MESGKSWLISARPGHKAAVPNRGAAWRLPPTESGAVLRGVLRRAGDSQTEQAHAARVQGLACTVANTGTAVCGTAGTVVWEGGGREPAPYPNVRPAGRTHLEVQVLYTPDRRKC